MKTSHNAQAGPVDLEGTTRYYNSDFGFTLFEEVVDPANPDGPRAIAMHVPAHAMSKAWQLVQPGYSEHMELLAGSANLVVNRAGTEDWTTMFLDWSNPTADDIELLCGDTFCVVTEDEEAVVLSRPSQPFEISFEEERTDHPNDVLSQYILDHVGSLEG